MLRTLGRFMGVQFKDETPDQEPEDVSDKIKRILGPRAKRGSGKRRHGN